MAWSSSPFSLQKGFSLFNRDVLHDAMFDAVIFSNLQLIQRIMSEFMLRPFGRQCSTLHYPGLVTIFQPGTKTSRGLTNILGHFLAIYNPPLWTTYIQVRPRSWKC